MFLWLCKWKQVKISLWVSCLNSPLHSSPLHQPWHFNLESLLSLLSGPFNHSNEGERSEGKREGTRIKFPYKFSSVQWARKYQRSWKLTQLETENLLPTCDVVVTRTFVIFELVLLMPFFQIKIHKQDYSMHQQNSPFSRKIYADV